MTRLNFYITYVTRPNTCEAYMLTIITTQLQGLESGMPFPPFSDYQDIFSSPLPPCIFASFIVPVWIPPPVQLLCLAKAIYPYWRECRIKRGGHRITPFLNVSTHSCPTFSAWHISSSTRQTLSTNPTSASTVAKSSPYERCEHHRQCLQTSFYADSLSLHSH